MTLIRLIKSSILIAKRLIDQYLDLFAMFKILSPIYLVFSSFGLILQFFTFASAHDIEATIRISETSPNTARISGKFTSDSLATDSNKLSFLIEYAGVSGLETRISDLRVNGSAVPTSVAKTSKGEFLSASKIEDWAYSVDLKPTNSQSAAAHVSWLSHDGGILVLDDLLPQNRGRSARIRIELPSGWKLYSSISNSSENTYEIPDIEKAAFFVGRAWREREVKTGGANFRLLLSGEWLFTDEQAVNMAAEVYAGYRKLFGQYPPMKAQIAVVKFPFDVPAGRWDAGVRGSNIVIASSDMPFQSQSVQRLHEQLRHEIFHLWVPGGLNLSGNYDWFYEGFALYQSLKLGVGVNRISFDDMLDTLSRTYRIDRMSQSILKPGESSLIDNSKNRWRGAFNSQIYARGMLVAFLCDLALMDASKGKRSTNDLIREIYARHNKSGDGRDGNAAIVQILRNEKVLIPIVERYILKFEALSWEPLINAIGLEIEGSDQSTKLKVRVKPSGRQKDLLDKLGYNNWRKTSKK